MKNKFFAVFLAIITLMNFNVCFIFANATGPSDTPQDGYSVIATVECEGGSLILYEHVKSGAKIVHWKNSDLEKGVGVAYRTYPQDNSGVNHVLEHCVCAGSPVYNDNNLFLNICEKVNSIYMNACTFSNFTLYAASTLFKSQLLSFLEMLMNCTLHPMFLEEKRIFSREGNRVELFDEDGALRINGTVYNEMIDRLSDGQRAEYNAMCNALLKDKNKFDSGGIPEEIEGLTYETLKKTWEKYYHPSNCLIMFYGDLDITPFLELLDKKFLSNYDKIDLNIEKPVYELVDSGLDTTIKYPTCVKTGENKYDAFKIYMAKKSELELPGNYYDCIAEAFLHPKSPFVRNIHKEFSYLDFRVNTCEVGENIGLAFVGKSMPHSDISKFNDIIEKSIEEVRERGLDESIIKSLKSDTPAGQCGKVIQKRLKRQRSFESTIYLLSELWENGEDDSWIYEFNKVSEFDVENLNMAIECFLQEDKLKKYQITAEADFEGPEVRYSQKQAALEKVKEKMTDAEKAETIKFTKDMSEWLKNGGNPDSYKQINNVKLNNVNFNIKFNEANEKYRDGVRVIFYEDKNAEKTYISSLAFGMEGFSKKELALAHILSELLGRIKTVQYSTEDLKSKMIDEFYYLEVLLNKERRNDKKFKTFQISWQGLSATYKNTLEMINELIFNSDFGDMENINKIIKELKFARTKRIYSNLPSIMIKRGEAILSGKSTIPSPEEDSILEALCELEEDLKSNPQKVTERLTQLLNKILSSPSVTLCLISDKDSLELCEKEFFTNCAYKKTEIQNEKKDDVIADGNGNKAPVAAKKEAVMLGSNLQCNAMLANYTQGTKYDAKFEVLGKIILDKYLMNKIRNLSGAYACNIAFDKNGVIVISSADPEIGVTWDVIKDLGKWLDELNLSQEELDEYKVKVYCEELNKFRNSVASTRAVYQKMMGLKEHIVYDLEQIKNMSLDDLRMLAEQIKDMIKDGYYFTVGNKDKIMKEKDRFENIIELNENMYKN